MLFRRREPQSFWQRVRTAVWPRRSFARSLRYFVKRVLRLTATPHAIAAGIAAGVFASWTPFLGFHVAIAAVLAWICAGNLAAAVIGTGFGNPLTFPFIWAASYELGTFVLDNGEARERQIDLAGLFRHLNLAELWQPILKPMTVGAVALGLASGLAFYGLTYWGVNSFRERRRLRMAERARAREEGRYSDNRAV
jgi:uncharacterized protein (DUF2062 family)